MTETVKMAGDVMGILGSGAALIMAAGYFYRAMRASDTSDERQCLTIALLWLLLAAA